ncbi:MAG: hypothetical protein HC904_09110 [Blastochloris sp.]|nr:hypothetical protein [Blastochloris sp.]
MARKAFFSFHYGKDVSRAHVVRNSWVTKEDREDAGFFDASVFESKKRTSDEILKAFLTEGLERNVGNMSSHWRRNGSSPLGSV